MNDPVGIVSGALPGKVTIIKMLICFLRHSNLKCCIILPGVSKILQSGGIQTQKALNLEQDVAGQVRVCGHPLQ